MQIIQNLEGEVTKIERVDSTHIQCFTETPSKTGQDQPVNRIEAFDLFNLFTADIIRSKKVFTR